MIIERKELYDLVSKYCIGEYAIGMHGINLSRMEELNRMNKDEGISNILKKGLEVYNSRTINGTIKFFGRIDTEEDIKKVREGLTNYKYGSNELIIIAIPTILKTENGSKLFLGSPNLESRYKENMGTTGYETTTLLDDVIMEKGTIKPEYILGRCKLLDSDNVEVTINPNHISFKNGIVNQEYYNNIKNKIIKILLRTGVDISIFENIDSIDEEKIKKLIVNLENKINSRKSSIFFNEYKEAFILETLHQLLKEKKLTKRVVSSEQKLEDDNKYNQEIDNINSESDFLKIYKKYISTKDEKEKNNYLKNDIFVISAIKYLDKTDLSIFFNLNYKHFNQKLLEQKKIMKPLTLKVYNAIQQSPLKFNLEAMREIASQPGIHPMIICYVDPIIQNDYQFISNIIVNTNYIDDFYGHSYASFDESNMRYGDAIGKDIQTNPMFWELLNALLKKKYPNRIRLFDTKKEIEIAKKHFSKIKEVNVERTSFNNKDNSINISLKKGEYFGEKNTYFIKFDYQSLKQGKYMLDVFMNKLCPSIGSHSYRFKENKDYIRFYIVDEFGAYTNDIRKAKGIGGTNIPEDLLYEFIRRMVEVDKCIIKCNDIVMQDVFSQEILDNMINSLNNLKTKK